MKNFSRIKKIFLPVIFLGLFMLLPAIMSSSSYGKAIKPEQDSETKTEPSGTESTVTMRILLAKIKGDLKVSAPGGIEVSTEGRELVKEYITPDQLVFRRDGDKIRLSDTGASEDLELGKEVIIAPLKEGEPLKINGSQYRGHLRVFLEKNFLWLVNLVPLEQYLYGVVPKEFRTNYMELAKAQAVVARTYALGHRGRFEKYNFDFTTGPQFQVYGGYDCEDALCNKAVDETRGLVILYDGKPAAYPLYHSTCGGATADNETVFLTRPIPYLRGQKCDSHIPEDEKESDPPGLENDSKGFAIEDIPQGKEKDDSSANDEKTEKKRFFEDEPSNNDENKTTPVNNDDNLDYSKELNLDENPPANCSQSGYYRWEVKWNNDELSKIIDKSFTGDDTGKISDLTAEKRGPSGRIEVLLIKTDKGEFRVRGDEIRRTFLFKNSKGTLRSLYSTRFNIEKKVEGGKTSWIFHGSGWGHGVGMCQFGALGLAKKGANYRQILKKYFKGITIGSYTQNH